MPLTFPPRPDYPPVRDPDRPAWHLAPPAHWMNDPNGTLFHRGWYHVFYQHNPGGPAWGDLHWGHARSRDLVHWEHLPLGLFPQHASGEMHCYSGGAACDGAGRPHIFYTSVPHDAARPAAQVRASPLDDDLVAWRQDVAHPALDLAHHGGPAFDRDWRDPYVFRAEGRTWLILGATLGDETVIPIYEARDDTLAAWAYRGILWRAPRAETPFFECPNLVRCGERWVLFVSPCREVAWWSGSLDLVGFRFHAERHGRVDESTHYYATQTAFAPDGRTILFGWVRNFPTGRNWNGCLGVPRRLWLDERGRLCTEPVTEVSALSSTPVPMLPRPAGDSDLAWTLEPATSYRGEVDVDLGPEGSARLHFAGVLVNISHSGVQIDEGPAIALDDPDESTRRFLVQWLFDRSLLEVFVNARVSLTRVVPYPPAGGVRVTTTGAARVVRAEVGRILA